MSLFDFFFRQEPAVYYVQKRIVPELRRAQLDGNLRRIRDTRQLAGRVSDLEGDVGFIVLVLGAMLNRLDEKGVVTRDDLKAALAQLDEADGVKDGKLDVKVLRGTTLG
jgi:hypothetical protein